MRLLFALFIMIPAVVLAARPQRVYKLPANESLTITTNKFGQITKSVSVVTNGMTNVVVFIDRGVKVPIKYRAIWSTLSEEQKLGLLFQSNSDTESTPVVYPKKVSTEMTYEVSADESIKIVKFRDEEEGE